MVSPGKGGAILVWGTTALPDCNCSQVVGVHQLLKACRILSTEERFGSYRIEMDHSTNSSTKLTTYTNIRVLFPPSSFLHHLQTLGLRVGGALLEGLRVGGALLEGLRVGGAPVEGLRVGGASLEGLRVGGVPLEGLRVGGQ